MPAVKTLKTRGLTRALLAHVNTLPPGEPLQLDAALVAAMRKDVPEATHSATLGACAYLLKLGELKPGPVRGSYLRVKGSGSHEAPDTVVIDELLNAMAKAEPVLRKWRRIQEALKDV